MTYHTLLATLEDVRQRMQRHPTQVVASVAGVHANTARAVRNGVNTNPTIGVLNALQRALDSIEGVEHD